ncbi:hypothetical protein [Pseudoduganella lutea]|uniref:Uncharacterized protein n=1 Tax=Pseudoduganella lutea TaxID=321985 RepID=A0A4P6L485_9BURK|nr:hypothetical protein [Pseudoduganella lutea]QBE66277.1 hypothetical protein EWM63_27590 [Pseudoduganella lutea]
MTTYANLNTSQIAAFQRVFDVLSAHHAPPFAAEFLQEFRVQILAAVLHEGPFALMHFSCEFGRNENND